MINFELFRHVYFATPRYPAVCCAYLDSLGELAFGLKSDFKNKCRDSPEFGLQNEARLQVNCNSVLRVISILTKNCSSASQHIL